MAGDLDFFGFWENLSNCSRFKAPQLFSCYKFTIINDIELYWHISGTHSGIFNNSKQRLGQFAGYAKLAQLIQMAQLAYFDQLF